MAGGGIEGYIRIGSPFPWLILQCSAAWSLILMQHHVIPSPYEHTCFSAFHVWCM